ncbi:16S rRNA (guanine(966)-N(2))-methyltransferase RsmD [Aphanothece hegewaldii CCALA 016]|uniref:16S rRNA (Guanine(966)-N(2))-methyltransferase RsmD n=1 Tax=Aphanothece hegewaldii CCALA 016 TaxID=2107694 RepID=A0A2T1LW55_9CHRO|nr:16S rRNA (guanine(966)-N(2))-methyltransferase RsmD [Aphanothece hegewaldii]PSF36130.1 16S rRNA (guanine(966)-N(2))-methyltransferase RsmD [Aphanothece hegewaldii CCALA 016]
MRIYGNRQLKTLSGQLTRPTLARVREALFNIWQGEISGCRWLDLCAGNGSMGAEALCRGAKLVIGIEQNGAACKIIQQNWEMVATEEQSFQVIRGDVLNKIGSLAGEQFERIYFDPPYASGLYERVLNAIVQYNLLAPDGEITVEHDPKQWKACSIKDLTISREKVYGNTALTFYFKSANAEYLG